MTAPLTQSQIAVGKRLLAEATQARQTADPSNPLIETVYAYRLGAWLIDNPALLTAAEDTARMREALERIRDQSGKIISGSPGPLYTAGFGAGWGVAQDIARATLSKDKPDGEGHE